MGSRDVLDALRGEERAGGGAGGGGGAGDGGGRGRRREHKHSWRRRRNAAASSVPGPRPAPRRKLTIDRFDSRFFAQPCRFQSNMNLNPNT